MQVPFNVHVVVDDDDVGGDGAARPLYVVSTYDKRRPQFFCTASRSHLPTSK